MFIVFNDGEKDIHCWCDENIPRIGDEVCVSQNLNTVHRVTRVIWLSAVVGDASRPDRVIVQVERSNLGIP